jgi:hypothetical protein
MSEVKPEAAPTTCIVGCKLPHGLTLELRTDDGKVVGKHTLKGNNAARIVGGYGLTENIPIDFMNEWLKRNAEHAAVKSHAVFIHTNLRGAEARAKEGRELKTGLEPIDPLLDARAKGLTVDKEAEANYRRQRAENPVRNRQQVE